MEFSTYRIDIILCNDNDCTYWDTDVEPIKLHPYERTFASRDRAIAYARQFSKADAEWALSHGNGVEYETVVCAVTGLLYEPEFGDEDPSYQSPIFENVWEHGNKQSFKHFRW